MNGNAFDAFNRRSSVAALGAAWLAALAGPVTADARKRKKTGDVNKQCKNQAAAWTSFVLGRCETGPECRQGIDCAEPLKTCNFGAFFSCLSTITG